MLDGKDYWEINNLIHLYFVLLDDGNNDAFAGLFTEDGLLDIPHRGLNLKGTENLKKAVTSTKTKLPNSMHWEGNVVITEENGPNTAKNVSYWRAVDGNDTISMGKHLDEFVKENGNWKFSKRKVLFSWTRESGHINANAT